MENLLDELRQQVGCNKATTPAQIKIADLKLRQLGLPEIPEKYADLLTKINGLSNEGSLIFGAETGDNHCFEDIVTANRTFFRGKKSDWLLLGRDESFYFIYEPASQNYHIIDQDSFEPEMTSADYEPVLVFLLKIE